MYVTWSNLFIVLTHYLHRCLKAIKILPFIKSSANGNPHSTNLTTCMDTTFPRFYCILTVKQISHPLYTFIFFDTIQ